MRKALLVGIVGLVGLLLGAAVAGRPQDVPSDIVSSEIQAPASVSTTTLRRPDTTRAETTSTIAIDPTNPGTPPPTSSPPTVAATTTVTLRATTTLVPATFVRVVVANATNIEGHAGRTAARLRQLGYSNVTAVDAATDRADTVIFHVDGRRGEALLLAQQLGYDPQRVRPRPNESLTVAGEEGENSELWLIVAEDSL